MKPYQLIGLTVINLVLVLVVVNGAVLRKQNTVDNGRTVFLNLAPRDPRSLMQGDYMVLRQDLLRDSKDRSTMADEPTRGTAIVTLDEKGIGSFSRPGNKGEEPAADEVRLKYRRSNRGYHFGLESFFFEEGQGKAYENARFSEIKVDEKGNAVLVDLRGENLAEIKPSASLPDTPR